MAAGCVRVFHRVVQRPQPSLNLKWLPCARLPLSAHNASSLCSRQVEAALADEWLSRGDRLGLQRRWLRLGEGTTRAMDRCNNACAGMRTTPRNCTVQLLSRGGTVSCQSSDLTALSRYSQGAGQRRRRPAPLGRASLVQGRKLGAAGSAHRGAPAQQHHRCLELCAACRYAWTGGACSLESSC